MVEITIVKTISVHIDGLDMGHPDTWIERETILKEQLHEIYGGINFSYEDPEDGEYVFEYKVPLSNADSLRENERIGRLVRSVTRR